MRKNFILLLFVCFSWCAMAQIQTLHFRQFVLRDGDSLKLEPYKEMVDSHLVLQQEPILQLAVNQYNESALVRALAMTDEEFHPEKLTYYQHEISYYEYSLYDMVNSLSWNPKQLVKRSSKVRDFLFELACSAIGSFCKVFPKDFASGISKDLQDWQLALDEIKKDNYRPIYNENYIEYFVNSNRDTICYWCGDNHIKTFLLLRIYQEQIPIAEIQNKLNVMRYTLQMNQPSVSNPDVALRIHVNNDLKFIYSNKGLYFQSLRQSAGKKIWQWADKIVCIKDESQAFYQHIDEWSTGRKIMLTQGSDIIRYVLFDKEKKTQHDIEWDQLYHD